MIGELNETLIFFVYLYGITHFMFIYMLQKYLITIFLSFFFLCGVISSFAQPAFTNSDFMQIGNTDTLSFDYVIDGNIPTATGANYSWDFSSVKGSQGLHYFVYRSPQHTGSDPYIAAGAVLEEWHASPVDEYALWKISGDTLYKMREGQGSGTTFTPPYAQFAFPMAFGSTFNSTTDFYAGATKASERQHSVIYDGYGTLKTKFGTFTNVFRLAIRDYDTSFILHNANDYRAFWWLKAGGAVPLFQVNQYAAAGTIYNAFVSHAQGVNSDVPEKNIEDVPVFYPNPAQNTITVSRYLSGKIIVQNALGATVRVYETTNALSFDLSGLSAGIYFLNYSIGGSIQRLPILKE
jgi:hypothetical protein